MTSTPHLIAFATQCTSQADARIEWTLATQDPDGDWTDWNGRQLHPFHTEAIALPPVTLPDGWVDHIQDICRQEMFRRPVVDLTEMLGLRKPPAPSAPFPRRL